VDEGPGWEFVSIVPDFAVYAVSVGGVARIDLRDDVAELRRVADSG
jgi:hypothetical protein